MNEIRFKAGDAVLCVDTKYSETNLTLGKIYTVIKRSSYSDDCVVLSGVGSEGYFDSRFIYASSLAQAVFGASNDV